MANGEHTGGNTNHLPTPPICEIGEILEWDGPCADLKPVSELCDEKMIYAVENVLRETLTPYPEVSERDWNMATSRALTFLGVVHKSVLSLAAKKMVVELLTEIEPDDPLTFSEVVWSTASAQRDIFDERVLAGTMGFQEYDLRFNDLLVTVSNVCTAYNMAAYERADDPSSWNWETYAGPMKLGGLALREWTPADVPKIPVKYRLWPV